MAEWKTRWNYAIWSTPSRPGIWRMKEGGFLIYGRVLLPGEKKSRRSFVRALPTATLPEATRERDEALAKLRDEVTGRAKRRPLWSTYAVSLYDRKVATREIKSAKTREKWDSTLRLHLIPVFGQLYVDEIRRADIELWRGTLAERVANGKLGVRTANDWMSTMRTITNAATAELELDRNAFAGVKMLDTSEAPAYTDEEPNALNIEETTRFLAAMAKLHPAHYAMTLLGFVTGLRPSTLRPLRRSGPTPDVLWDEGAILIRRSNTRRDEVMNTTKTGKRQRVALPEAMMQALRDHVAAIECPPMSKSGKPPLWWREAMADSELLFPARTGKFRSASSLDKPFADVAKHIGLGKAITPRGMRRTYQDLARAAGMHGIIKRSVSGHATETMEEHYSTVAQTEMRQGLAKVISLVDVRARGLAIGLATSKTGAGEGIRTLDVHLGKGQRVAFTQGKTAHDSRFVGNGKRTEKASAQQGDTASGLANGLADPLPPFTPYPTPLAPADELPAMRRIAVATGDDQTVVWCDTEMAREASGQ